MRFRVEVRRADGVSDPEARTVLGALKDLGFDEVRGIGFGRSIEVDMVDVDDAEARVREMCDRLLANPVIEDFTITRLDQ